MTNVNEIIEFLKDESEKLLEYYDDLLDMPDAVENDVRTQIERLDTYIEQLPLSIRDGIIDFYVNYMVGKKALGICYACFGPNTRISELIAVGIINKGLEEEAEYENELVMDTYDEYLASVLELMYLQYTAWTDLAYDTHLVVVINLFEIISNADYMIDDIGPDMEEIGRLCSGSIDEFKDNDDINLLEYNHYSVFSEYVETLKRKSEQYEFVHIPTYDNFVDPTSYIIDDFGYDVGNFLIRTMSDAIRQLLDLKGFILTEYNRTEVIDYIVTYFAEEWYKAVFNIDINNIQTEDDAYNVMETVFEHADRLSVNTLISDLRDAVIPYIDFACRLLIKIGFPINTQFRRYSEYQQIAILVKFKRGYEDEILNSNFRKNKVTRRLSVKGVVRDNSRVKEFIHSQQRNR